MNKPRHSRFTLLELLVALVASAVLMAALFSALGGAWRLQRQAHEAEVAEAPRSYAWTRLQQDFQQAVPPAGLLAGPLISEAIEAGAWRHDELELVSAVGSSQPGAPWGDLARVSWYLSEDDTTSGAYRLVRTIQPNLLATEEEELTENVVLENVISLSFSWYDGEDWVDSWDSTAQDSQLPEAVKVRIDVVDGEPLELIVPLVMRSLLTAEATTQ